MTTETTAIPGTQAWAAEHPLPIGAAMPAFELPEPASGKTRSSCEIASQDVVAVFFISSGHCPHSMAWEDRILDVARAYQGRVSSVFICSTDPKRFPEDGPDVIAATAKNKRFPGPYLQDADQRVANEFSAYRTPHAFVFRGGTLVYNGTIDDNAEEPSAVTKTYLRDALEAAVAGRPVAIPTTELQGRGIKRKTDKAAGGR